MRARGYFRGDQASRGEGEAASGAREAPRLSAPPDLLDLRDGVLHVTLCRAGGPRRLGAHGDRISARARLPAGCREDDRETPGPSRLVCLGPDAVDLHCELVEARLEAPDRHGVGRARRTRHEGGAHALFPRSSESQTRVAAFDRRARQHVLGRAPLRLGSPTQQVLQSVNGAAVGRAGSLVLITWRDDVTTRCT